MRKRCPSLDAWREEAYGVALPAGTLGGVLAACAGASEAHLARQSGSAPGRRARARQTAAHWRWRRRPGSPSRRVSVAFSARSRLSMLSGSPLASGRRDSASRRTRLIATACIFMTALASKVACRGDQTASEVSYKCVTQEIMFASPFISDTDAWIPLHHESGRRA